MNLLQVRNIEFQFFYTFFINQLIKQNQMKAKLLLCVCALVVGLTFNSCKPSDEKTQKEVATALAEMPSISAGVKSGVATLTGTVDSEEIKANAETVVAAIKDVKSVVNNIQVVIPEAPEISPDDALRNTVVEAVSKGGDKFKDVTVEVKDGEVTLTGVVNRSNLEELMQVANEAKPKKVNNLLNIRKQ